MMRPTALLFAAIVAIGCRAPVPTFDPLAPYGKTTVPPPSTGSYGAPNSYYQQPPQSGGLGASNSAAPATNPAIAPRTAAVAQASATARSPAASETTKPAADIAPASFLSSSRTAASGGGEAVRVVERSSASPSPPAPLELRGMPVNDATEPTGASPPAIFAPQGSVVDISLLPQPGAPAPPPLRLRGLPSEATGEIGTSVTTGNQPAGPGGERWRSRYSPSASLQSPLAQKL